MASAVAALVVLAARQGVQQVLSRLLYGRRREPESIVVALTRRLEGAGGPDAILEAVASDLAEALKLEAVTINGARRRTPGRPGPVAARDGADARPPG
jgi:hypothetical protein